MDFRQVQFEPYCCFSGEASVCRIFVFFFFFFLGLFLDCLLDFVILRRVLF